VTRLGLALLLSICAVACEREAKPEVAQTEAELDLGAIRVSIVDGLEAAVSDPATAQALELTVWLETAEAKAALERMLARVTANPELGRRADAFFLALQDSPAMRAALLEHTRKHPELVDSDLGALRESFIAEVEQRLTREELAVLLERQLRVALSRADVPLAQAWISEAGGASALAAAVLTRLEDPAFRSQLEQLLGREDLQNVLVRRFAAPKRAAALLFSFVPAWASSQAMIEVLDHPHTAKLFAVALGRLLEDEQVRTYCEELFAMAIAPQLDTLGFTRALLQLLVEPAVSREASALLGALARDPVVRGAVTKQVEELSGRSEFDAVLLQALD
jgi:hypothetical protein